MPDLKSELSKVLNEWNPEEPTTMTKPQEKPYFTVTNNVTRVTFDYVRDNPGKTRKEIAVALTTQGYKSGSVTSLLGQMLKQNLLRDNAGLLYTTTDKYAPLKASMRAAVATKNLQAPQRKVVKLVNTRTGEVLNPKPAAKEWEPNDVIDKLTVHQAIALFKALRGILVG